MTEQDRIEQELVQEALAGLPRPTPPPRLRRAVMARVRREADALQAQAQVWRRTDAGGWAVEWRQYNPAPPPAPPPSPAVPPRATFTQWRYREGTRVTVYQTTRTH